MRDKEHFLPETETAVPIIHPPGSGKAVGVLRDKSTFKVLCEETGGAYGIISFNVEVGYVSDKI